MFSFLFRQIREPHHTELNRTLQHAVKRARFANTRAKFRGPLPYRNCGPKNYLSLGFAPLEILERKN